MPSAALVATASSKTVVSHSAAIAVVVLIASVLWNGMSIFYKASSTITGSIHSFTMLS